MKFPMNREQAVQATVALLRVIASVMFIQVGGLKLFGWFGGMPPGVALSPLLTTAGILEVFGGALMLLGLFTRPVAFVLAGEMAFAYFLGHFSSGAFWPIQNHGELAVLFCFLFLFFAAYGAERWSLDGLLRARRHNPSQP